MSCHFRPPHLKLFLNIHGGPALPNGPIGGTINKLPYMPFPYGVTIYVKGMQYEQIQYLVGSAGAENIQGGPLILQPRKIIIKKVHYFIG